MVTVDGIVKIKLSNKKINLAYGSNFESERVRFIISGISIQIKSH